MLPNRWVIFWNNQPVGLDADSGGYPYKTDFPGLVKYWKSKEEAQAYLDVITTRGSSNTYISDYAIKEIQFKIVG